MLRTLYLAMTVLVLAGITAAAEAPPDLGANAALQYWQAFAQLPKFTDAEGQKLNAECLTMPLDVHAREIVNRAAYALRMMHRGAALPRCDWAMGWEEDGIEVRLPHQSAARVLSSLVCLRARLRFEEGRQAEAIEDVVAALTLARHGSLDGSIIALLVGYHIEHRMGETLALYLPKLDAKTIKDLKTRLDALPPGGSLATAVRLCEEKTLSWFVRKVKEAKDKERLLAFLWPILDSPEKGRAFLEACGGTAAGVLQFAEEMRPWYGRMAQKLELPPESFAKEFEREERKYAGNPVFKLFAPALVKCRQSQERADVHRALLSAALAVQLEGEGALKNHPDPVGGSPFVYAAFEGGFELRSKLKGKDDKPVALTAGRRGK